MTVGELIKQLRKHPLNNPVHCMQELGTEPDCTSECNYHEIEAVVDVAAQGETYLVIRDWADGD